MSFILTTCSKVTTAGGIWRFMGSVYIQLFLSVLLSVVASLVMSPDERGTLAALLQISYLFPVLVLSGYDRLAPTLDTRVAPLDLMVAARRRMVVATIFVLILLIAPSSPYLSGVPRTALPAVAAVMLGLCLTASRILDLTGLQDDAGARSLARKRMVFLLATALSALALVLLQSKSQLSWLALGYLAPIFALLFVERKRLVVRRLPAATRLATLRTRASRLSHGPVAHFVSLRLDRYFLAFFASPGDLGRYAMLAAGVEMSTLPVKVIFDQTVSGAVGSSQVVQTLSTRWASALAFGSGSSTLVISRSLVPSLLGEEYLLSRQVGLLLSLATVALVMGTYFLSVATTRSESNAASTVPEVAGMVVTVLGLVFLPVAGHTELAALSTLSGYSAFAIAAA